MPTGSRPRSIGVAGETTESLSGGSISQAGRRTSGSRRRGGRGEPIPGFSAKHPVRFVTGARRKVQGGRESRRGLEPKGDERGETSPHPSVTRGRQTWKGSPSSAKGKKATGRPGMEEFIDTPLAKKGRKTHWKIRIMSPRHTV